ncbi:SMP-30/gluconolactonase/LRE family protein, partial [Paracoccus sp. (in: a-proteobacteria)]|uniref:SMP-30/gluconolactonase/LRE family protein n=1 Tax=Paracoccus sp. TaxID=267 RepID=UPI003A89B71F
NNLGEGPLWDCAEQRLYWVDSTAAEIWTCRADGRDARRHFVDSFIGSMALRRDGGAVLALASGFAFYDFATQSVTPICNPLESDGAYRFNDGKVDRAGRFFAGAMGMDFDPSNVSRPRVPARDAGLFRLDPDLSVHQLESGLICSNGPCWSPDDRTFYFGDSEHKRIWAYDYDIATGEISNRREFASDENLARTVDGATVDSEGYLWNAKVLGGRILRYAPDGTIDRQVDFPVRNVTSLIFGGADLDILFVTTMGRPMRGISPTESGAGGIFAIYGLGVTGLPEPRFGG